MKTSSEFDKYCEDFTTIVCKDLFANVKKISGNDILKITPIKQLNLLMIKNLLVSWKIELKNLESPYFDYSHPEVDQALKNFRNTLSRHIAVDEEHLSTLLKKSIKEAISLAIYPLDFYRELIEEGMQNGYTLADFKDVSKYIKMNSLVMHKILEEFDQVDQNKEGLFTILENLFLDNSLEPDDPKGFIEELSKILLLPTTLLSNEKKSPKDETGIKREIDFDLHQKEEKKVEIEKTLNDTFSVENNVTISDVLTKQKIDDIKKSLTINQKFMFVEHLFSGEVELFENTINSIEKCGSYKEAIEFIHSNYSWDMESEEVTEFMDIVEKRFN